MLAVPPPSPQRQLAPISLRFCRNSTRVAILTEPNRRSTPLFRHYSFHDDLDTFVLMHTSHARWPQKPCCTNLVTPPSRMWRDSSTLRFLSASFFSRSSYSSPIAYRGILCFTLQVNTDGTEGDGPYVGIKSPMFSWKRLLGADPTLVPHRS